MLEQSAETENDPTDTHGKVFSEGFTWQFDGFSHQVIHRTKNIALVLKSSPSGYSSYEVALIRHFPASSYNDIQFPAGERYPPSTQWGSRAWSYPNKDDALKKVADLKERGPVAP